jgi:hypothetical protein
VGVTLFAFFEDFVIFTCDVEKFVEWKMKILICQFLVIEGKSI